MSVDPWKKLYFLVYLYSCFYNFKILVELPVGARFSSQAAHSLNIVELYATRSYKLK